MLAREGGLRQSDCMMKQIVCCLVPLMAACGYDPGPVVPETQVERQMIGLLEKFDRFDYNGDGSLDLDELKEASESSGHSPRKIMDFYDTSGNNRISLREAQAGFARVEEAEARAANRM
jgi:hypothetical protein